MQMQEKVKVRMRYGIDGDRYALQTGAFSNSKPTKVRDITLITKVGIDKANQKLVEQGLSAFDICESRRNIVVENLLPEELNDLVGKIFFLGSIELKGMELCIPCERPSRLANKKGFLDAFANCGGIRAQVLDDGEIALGNALLLNSSTRSRL